MSLSLHYGKDYKRFCLKCSWNDPDMGCTSRFDEAVYQCDMYRHYHPKEVKEFEKSMEEWTKRLEGDEDDE